MTLKCTMFRGDCLEVMPTLDKASFVFADLPYGVTARNTWDVKLNQKDVINTITSAAPEGIQAYTATAKFASETISLLGDLFRYDLVWNKNRVSGFLNAKRAPMRVHEWILIAGKLRNAYTPILTRIDARSRPGWGTSVRSDTKTKCYGEAKKPQTYTYRDTRLPTSIINATVTLAERGLHPTQKPVALLDWLIRTYSNDGDHVLDPTSGSGTTAVAALSCGRNVTCIEKDEGYFTASVERVRKHVRDNFIRANIEVVR